TAGATGLRRSLDACSGSSPGETLPGVGSSDQWASRRQRVGRSPGGSFWVRPLRAEELPGLTQDRNLGLELSNPLASSTQLDRFNRRLSRNLTAVDAILLQPVVQAAGADAELVRGLLHLLARTHQRHRAS